MQGQAHDTRDAKTASIHFCVFETAPHPLSSFFVRLDLFINQKQSGHTDITLLSSIQRSDSQVVHNSFDTESLPDLQLTTPFASFTACIMLMSIRLQFKRH